MEAYTGEKTEEAVFNGVLLPVAKEYVISVSYEELKDYIDNLADFDEIMDKEELKQIAGGKGGGLGAGKCFRVGIGWGYAGGDDGSVGCIIVGHGFTYCCIRRHRGDTGTVLLSDVFLLFHNQKWYYYTTLLKDPRDLGRQKNRPPVFKIQEMQGDKRTVPLSSCLLPPVFRFSLHHFAFSFPAERR